MSTQRSTTALIILDGFGYSENPESNAIHAARTPTWDKLWSEQPHTLISGSGNDVGLPDGQMGNSEVGHMNLGAGRIVYQELTRVGKAIKDGDFFSNSTLCAAVDKAVKADKAVHILGLLSPGGVHSHEDHISAMIKLAAERGAKQVYLHAFLDGRDTPPRSASDSIAKLDAQLRENGLGRIASVIGRYYAMDRDQRWDRVQLGYDLLTQAQGKFTYSNATEALTAAYARDENDEFVQASVIANEQDKSAAMNDGDAVIFMNFRADRARQLTRSFVEQDFAEFERKAQPKLAEFVTLTQYAASIKTPCAFAPSTLTNSLGEQMQNLGKTQLRIAETEKYAHVTFFFSGGREEPFVGEERILIPSPDVATYDLQPEMNAVELTDKLVEAIRSGQHDLIVCNYANGDMVGHTGVFSAAVTAVETLDACLARIQEALEEVQGQCLITADHGNVEQMEDANSGQAHTAHTCEPVPLVYIGPKDIKLEAGGVLSDIAPSLLQLMDLPQPAEMTGKSVIA